MSATHTARRTFLKNAGAIGLTALNIGLDLTAPTKRAHALAAPDAAPPPFAPNAFVRIGTDDSITVISKHLEMGQGNHAGLAAIVAEVASRYPAGSSADVERDVRAFVARLEDRGVLSSTPGAAQA